MLNSKLIPWWRVLIICAMWGQMPANAEKSDLPSPLSAQAFEQVDSSKNPTKTENDGNEGKGITLSSLERIQTETVIIEAQVARANALKSLEDSGSSGKIQDVTTGIPAAGVNVSQAQEKTTPLPQIKEIYGAGSRLIARLVLDDGSYAELTAGQQVPGTTLKITSISAREVRVSALDGGGQRVLPFN